MKKIALVTVNFGGVGDTLELLESVKKLDTAGLELRMVIVDATPDDWIGDHIKDTPGFLDILQAGKNKGFAGNYNFGMRYAAAWGADYIVIINNDTLVGDGSLIKKLIKVFEENPKASVVSPKIYFAPGYEFHKDRYKKDEEGKVIWYGGGSFDWGNVRSIHRGIDEVDKGQFEKTESTDFVSGACLMFKSGLLEKTGYFDESLFAYFEDNDWQERIKKDGGKLFYCGGTHIYHKVSRTSGIGSENTDYLLTRNRLYFTFRYASFRTKLAVAREALKLLFTGRKAQKTAVLDFIRGVKGPSPYQKRISGKYKYPVRLSILISNFKTTDLTAKLLESIFDNNSGYNPEIDEVLVLDDASGEDFEKLKADFPRARFLENKVNRGFVASYNRLLDYCRGKLLLLLNSDIEVRPRALSEMVETNKKFGGRSVLTGKLLFPDGGMQDSCFRLPTISGAIKEYFLKEKGSYFMFRPQSNKPVKVEGAVMAAFMIPRAVFNQIGRLNSKLVMYFEDIDYCRRLKKAGIPIYYCPDSMFYHHHGASSKKAGETSMNKQLIESSKIYHGKIYYYLLTFILWLGQKVGRSETY
jgi:GT2 family glycosyltransferase